MNIGIARSNHFIQLSYIYSIVIVFTCYYALDSAITVKSILVNLNIAAFKADASCASACTSDGLNSSQSSVQCQTAAVNYEIFLVLVQLHRNCIFVSLINSNTIACSIGGIGINRRKVYACFISVFAGYCQSFTT